MPSGFSSCWVSHGSDLALHTVHALWHQGILESGGASLRVACRFEAGQVRPFGGRVGRLWADFDAHCSKMFKEEDDISMTPVLQVRLRMHQCCVRGS